MPQAAVLSSECLNPITTYLPPPFSVSLGDAMTPLRFRAARESASAFAPSPARADVLALLEDALAQREEALLSVERLLAGPCTPEWGALAAARTRVEELAAAGARLLDELEAATGLGRPGRGAC